MTVQFSKWGNSVAIRIPTHLIKELGVAEGGSADLKIENGRLILCPISNHRRYSLEELVSGITENNCHDEFDFGHPVGREIW